MPRVDTRFVYILFDGCVLFLVQSVETIETSTRTHAQSASIVLGMPIVFRALTISIAPRTIPWEDSIHCIPDLQASALLPYSADS